MQAEQSIELEHTVRLARLRQCQFAANLAVVTVAVGWRYGQTIGCAAQYDEYEAGLGVGIGKYRAGDCACDDAGAGDPENVTSVDHAYLRWKSGDASSNVMP